MAIDDAEHYPVPAAMLFNGAVAALQQLGWTIVMMDPSSSMVRVATSASLASWGENITLRVVATGSDSSTLYTTVALKFGLVDWGKRRSRLADLKTTLGRTLGLATAGWYPDPWGIATLRWWDGRAWTGMTT